MAAPSGSVEAFPTEEDLAVFRIPSGTFVKLHAGTWHAGPLFASEPHMDFYNLELSDTNVVSVARCSPSSSLLRPAIHHPILPQPTPSITACHPLALLLSLLCSLTLLPPTCCSIYGATTPYQVDHNTHIYEGQRFVVSTA